MQQFLFLSHSFNARRASALGLPPLSGVLAPPSPSPAPQPPSGPRPISKVGRLRSSLPCLSRVEFWEAKAQPRLAGAWLQGSRFAIGAFFHLPRSRAGTEQLPGLLAFFFFPSFRSFKPVYLWATWGPGSRQTNLGTSQEEEGQERGTLQGDNGVRKKDGTPLPLQNPSFSLQYPFTKFLPMPGTPSDMEKYRASSERDQKTPHSSLLRRELSLSLCHESMKDGMTSSAMVARAGSREEVT